MSNTGRTDVKPGFPDIPKIKHKKFQDGGRPAGYLAFLPGLFALCEELGYNLCVHGSLCKDFDLVAIAWAHGAVTATELIDHIAKHVGGKIQDDLDCDAHDFTKRGAEPKPHGRYAWTIHMGGGPMLDISVMGPESDSIHKSFERMDTSRALFENAKMLRPFTKPTQYVKDLAKSLFNHIKHGDEAHQAWLELEALRWCAANFGDQPGTAVPTTVKKTERFAPSENFETQFQLAVIIAARDESCPNRMDCDFIMFDKTERKSPPDYDPLFDGPEEMKLNLISEVRMPENPKWLMRCVCKTHSTELVRIRDHENNITYEKA